MARKQRNTMTLETYNVIVRMTEDEDNSIKKISAIVDFDRETVSNVIKNHISGGSFMSANEKRSNTVKERNSVYNDEELFIMNSVSCNNVLIQREIADKIKENMNIIVSQPTISRKLKRLKITRKRLSLVPCERNSNEKLDARAMYASDISRI